MGKLAFRFSLGRGGGGGGGGGGAVPPYLPLAGPPFLLLTLLGIGPGRRRGRASRRGSRACGGAQGRFAAFGPRHRFEKGECACAGSPPAPSFGRSPAGRGPGGGALVFFLLLEMLHVADSLPVFQLSRPEGGLAALPGTSRGRGGGVGAGTEGEGRPWYSSSGFRSRYRPFGATNPKLAPRAPLKCCVGVH